MVTVFDSLNQEQANAFSLVLNSSGIGNRVTRSNDGFRIDVPKPYTKQPGMSSIVIRLKT